MINQKLVSTDNQNWRRPANFDIYILRIFLERLGTRLSCRPIMKILYYLDI